MSARTRIWVTAVLVVLTLAGCGGTGSGSTTLGENDNGHTVRVAVGATVDVVLHSTEWRFSPLTGTDVLRTDRAPVTAASRGPGCAAGDGCGTVTATYTAVGAGFVYLQATRTTCGEAYPCPPDKASFEVTILVSGGSGSMGTASASPVVPANTVTATDADNGRTITVPVGDRLMVTLVSGYRHFADLDDDSVLREVAQPAVTAPPTGCLPGMGCGTVSVIYVARAGGTVTVAADRTSCGEALRCTGAEGTYRLHVVVR